MRTHICLCPCQCSQLEPLCIHTYANKYICFSYYRFTDTFVYDCVVRTHICLCPCECSQLELLCIHRYIHKFTNFILQILLCMTSCCANSHMSVPLRLLTLRTPFCVHILTSIYNYIYIYQASYHGYVGISTCAVHSHTCLCPCECSNFEPVCIHACVHKYIYICISYRKYFYI